MEFGFNRAADEWNATEFARAASNIAPGSVVRVGVRWDVIQGTCHPQPTPLFCDQPGPMDWAALDAELQPLAANGLRVVLNPLAAPRWAMGALDQPRNDLDRPVFPPGDNALQLFRWTQFVAALVDHVQTTFPTIGIAGVEIWNEPNGNYFWTIASGVNPARYARVLCAGYDGVKAVDPTIPVIFAGTYSQDVTDLPRVMRPDDFIHAAYIAGAGDCMDMLGVHPYPRHQASPLDGFLQYVNHARSVTVMHRDFGRPLAITELGFPTLVSSAEHRQAEFHTRAYHLAAAMPDVRMFIVHSLFDAVDLQGVCFRPSQPKPAASALRLAVSGSTEPASC